MKKIFIFFFTAFLLINLFAQAPSGGQITLNHLDVTCPIFPLNVAGSFIAPQNTTLDNNKIILEVKDAANPTVALVATITKPTVSGTDFSFDIKRSDFFPDNAPVINKNFILVAKATFKGVANNYSVISSQININPDVIFNGCQVCNNCVIGNQPQSHGYRGVWDCPDDIHNPEINSWVDYINADGIQKRAIIGCHQNGCQKISAVSIVRASGVTPCTLAKSLPVLKGATMACTYGEISIKNTGSAIIYFEDFDVTGLPTGTIYKDQGLSQPFNESGYIIVNPSNTHDGQHNLIYSVSPNGEVNFEGNIGGPC